MSFINHLLQNHYYSLPSPSTIYILHFSPRSRNPRQLLQSGAFFALIYIVVWNKIPPSSIWYRSDWIFQSLKALRMQKLLLAFLCSKALSTLSSQLIRKMQYIIGLSIWWVVWCNGVSLCSFSPTLCSLCGASVMGFLVVDRSSFSSNFHFFFQKFEG